MTGLRVNYGQLENREFAVMSDSYSVALRGGGGGVSM